MRDIREIKAAVVGTGFIGVVHVEALRRLGVEVTGIVGSSPERAAEKARAAGAAGAVPELRGDARRPRGRRRPPHHAQPPALRAGARRARGRQARRVREAAGHELGGDGRAAAPGRRERTRPRGQLQHPLLRPEPGGAGAHRARRDRRRAADLRRLPAGLAAARHRLELAPGPGGRRLAARGRRHRLALDRPRDLPHRPPRRGRDGRPDDLHRRAQAADGPGRDVQRRERRRDRRHGDGDRGRGRHPAAPDRRRTRGGDDLAGVGGPQEPPELGDRRLRVRARVALRGARGALARPSRAPERAAAARARRLPAGPRRGLPGHLQAPLPRGLRGRGGGRAAGRAGLPDVRRRPRGGADRRRRSRARTPSSGGWPSIPVVVR